MKKAVIIILSILFFHPCFSQANWGEVHLGKWGQIKLSPALEIQAGKYKKILDRMKRHYSVNARGRVVFQQKGVNEGKNLDTYARVIIRTDYSKRGFPNLNTSSISRSELNKLEQVFKNKIYKVARSSPFPSEILKWNGLKLVTLNGSKSIHFSYIRKMKGKKTYSEFYIFWMGHYQHSLNIEYRIEDSYKWRPILEKTAQSFKIKSQAQERFVSSQYGYSFAIPEGWHIKTVSYNPGIDGKIIDDRGNSFIVAVQPTPSSFKNSSFISLYRKLDYNQLYNSLGKLPSGTKILDRESSYLAGKKCYYIKTSEPFEDNLLLLHKMFLYNNHRNIYAVTFSYISSMKLLVEPAMKLILKSFSF